MRQLQNHREGYQIGGGEINPAALLGSRPARRIRITVWFAEFMTNKTQITKGSRVLVKTRAADGSFKIREGKIVDAHRDCLKVEYRWWLFRRSEWLPIKDDWRTLEFLSANE